MEDWVRWTYGAQQAHKVDDRMRLVGQPMGYPARDSVARAAEANALGAIIHGSGVVCRLHPDAELVHDCVTRMQPLQRGLVFEFGITGVAPIGLACAGKQFRHRQDQDGKPMMLRDHRRMPIGCMVEEQVPEMTILFWRRTYLTWWEAMLVLAATLRDEGLRSCGDPVSNLSPWALTNPASQCA